MSDSILVPAENEISDELFQEIKHDVEAAVFNMVKYASAFALVLEHTKTFLTTRVPTAGVDQLGRLFVNPTFWRKQTAQQQMFLLAHEGMHVALLHCRRGMMLGNHMLFNIVADLIINRLLVDTFGDRGAMPEGGLLLDGYFYGEPDLLAQTTVEEMFDLAEHLIFGLTNSKEKNYLGETLHKKYPRHSAALEEILKKYLEEGDSGGGTGGSGPRRIWTGDLKSDSEGDDLERDGVPVHQGGADPPENDEDWKDVAAQAQARATAAGQGSAQWNQLIGDLLEPKITWPEALIQRISTIVSKDVIDDYTYSKPNAFNYMSRIIFPTPIGHKHRGIVAIDTSGSMGHAWKQAISDFDHVRRKYGIEYYLMWQDSEIHPEGWIKPTDPLPENAVGFGGTDFIQIFDHIKENGIHKEADFAVIFTDAYGPFPDDHLDLQVLWVLYDSDVVPPFGDVIRIAS